MLDAVDAWINPNPPEIAVVWREQPYPKDVAERLFKHRTEEIQRGVEMPEMVRRMREHGITGGVLTAMQSSSPWETPREFNRWVAERCAEHPDLFVGAGGVDPRDRIDAVRQVEEMVRELGFKMVRLMPAVVELPPTHALYYPIYAKCVELRVPVSLTVGVPGPKVPADVQHPRHLDQVCCDFPDLVVVATHMGNPWTEELVAYMAKHEHLHLMTSAWAPRHYPAPILRFLNSARGRHKVMWASDYPLMGFEETVEEARKLDFRDEETARMFLSENCRRVLDWH